MHFSIIIMATPLQSAVEARLKGGKAKPRELNLDSVRLTSGEFFFFCVLLFLAPSKSLLLFSLHSRRTGRGLDPDLERPAHTIAQWHWHLVL